ncbi:MAG: hypothetical protein IJV42_09225 [Bacteroidaceae bacterium]|nr:hypothetical protein [Bacteroidaceae bacterium]
MIKRTILLLFVSMAMNAFAQVTREIPMDASHLEGVNGMPMSFEMFDGYQVLHVVPDENAPMAMTLADLGLDANQTDNGPVKAMPSNKPPQFVKVKDVDFHNGTIELKVWSHIVDGAPELARGFMGVMFRINADYSRNEYMYIRPLNAMVDDQVRRNHTLQYASNPGLNFVLSRQKFPEKYESYAEIALDCWILLRIVVKDSIAKLYINNHEQPSLVVTDLWQGPDLRGSVGISVGTELGTEGYFRDLKITTED